MTLVPAILPVLAPVSPSLPSASVLAVTADENSEHALAHAATWY
jgi:hypothetical protein